MTARVMIDNPVNGKTLRLAIEHDNKPDVEIKHIQAGETWSGFVGGGFRIVALEEVSDTLDRKVGRTHIGNMARASGGE